MNTTKEKGRYCKVVSKETGDTIAYLDRHDCNEFLIDEGELFMHQVYNLYTAEENEVETYGLAFDSVPVYHVSDIAVFSLGWTLNDRHESDNGPWFWEPKKRTWDKDSFNILKEYIHTRGRSG